MRSNVGGAEWVVRILVGPALLALGFFHLVGETLAIIAYVGGAIAVIRA